MQSVMTHRAPAAIGPYSQAILMNNILFISGQLGIDPGTSIIPESFEEQANLVFNNIKAILDAAGMGMSNIVKVSVFIKDLDDFELLNDIYTRYLSAPYPAREVVQISRLPKNGKIEISVIAMR
ncbi:MAG TPA: Rid family detoxifying hydrolase [Candidatus Cloacimonas sp.]|jgi:2-iminobutanoate/2-iminopropanoate deaminase|nr:Rid family detoxifying hydrolase [Candidatus Cloacimonas sp.]HNX02130.1 Rid family detoxifying hydrolase [Candidatus Cloacimonas sp.]HPS59796.1 Rid family detoxifying hydrolase [Candidatus Cloacimonas sp.]